MTVWQRHFLDSPCVDRMAEIIAQNYHVLAVRQTSSDRDHCMCPPCIDRSPKIAPYHESRIDRLPKIAPRNHELTILTRGGFSWKMVLSDPYAPAIERGTARSSVQSPHYRLSGKGSIVARRVWTAWAANERQRSAFKVSRGGGCPHLFP